MDQSHVVVGDKFRVRQAISKDDDDDGARANASIVDDDSEAHQTTTGINYFTTDALPMMTYYKQTLSAREARKYRPTLQDLHDPKIQVHQLIVEIDGC